MLKVAEWLAKKHPAAVALYWGNFEDSAAEVKRLALQLRVGFDALLLVYQPTTAATNPNAILRDLVVNLINIAALAQNWEDILDDFSLVMDAADVIGRIYDLSRFVVLAHDPARIQATAGQ